MFLRTRNTAVITAILFLIVVIVLRVVANVFGSNIEQMVGAIFAGSAEDIQVFDLGSIDLSWLNPETWSFDEIASGLNAWFHSIVDAVFPAVISSVSHTPVYPIVAIQPEVVSRSIQASVITTSRV